MFYIPGGLLFFFLAINLSLSALAAGSDSVGARYFLPELLPILSDLGNEQVFLLRCLTTSLSLKKYILKTFHNSIGNILYFQSRYHYLLSFLFSLQPHQVS